MPRSEISSSKHKPTHIEQQRIIPGGVVPTFFDSVKSGFGWGIGTSLARTLFSSPVTTTPVKGMTEYEQCIADHRDDCAQFAEKK